MFAMTIMRPTIFLKTIANAFLGWWAATAKRRIDPGTLKLPPQSATPDVSVLILSYGQVDYTLRCLDSIAQHPPKCGVEIVVSDDCSGAPDIGKLEGIANLRNLQPPQNLGFLRHANWAAEQTQGKFILLLNNDTELRAGAIDALLELAVATPNIGLVGSKLIYPNGKLQEAGGIIWDDASAWNYGWRDDPAKSQYNYVRDADYISGASILVPRAIWDRFNGFDEAFAPAYCEDSDLAMRLRQSGLRVLYQPASEVVHYEGITHGKDLKSGVKSYQLVNQERLREKWRSTLQAEHYRNGEHVMRARDHAKNRRVMLMIDHYVPEPDRDAGSRTMVELIKSLQIEGWIVKFWPDALYVNPQYTRQLEQKGVEVMRHPWVKSFDKWLQEFGHEIDIVFLSRPNISDKYLPAIQRIIPTVPTLFYGHDLHSARMRMQAAAQNDQALATEADKMEVIERRIWRSVDAVVYPSNAEADEVRAKEPAVDARAIVPFCFDDLPLPRSPSKSALVQFVAGFAHPPNIDAALWLAQEIFPLVKCEIPAAKLSIVGSNPVQAVKDLASESIEVTGYVSAGELTRRYSEARVAVAPMRIGAGVKLKVVESLHNGLPLVTTSVGAQGLPGLSDVVPVSDSARILADALIHLLQDDEAWVAQADRQLAYVNKHFSRQASIRAMNDAISMAFQHAKDRLRDKPRGA